MHRGHLKKRGVSWRTLTPLCLRPCGNINQTKGLRVLKFQQHCFWLLHISSTEINWLTIHALRYDFFSCFLSISLNIDFNFLRIIYSRPRRKNLQKNCIRWSSTVIVAGFLETSNIVQSLRNKTGMACLAMPPWVSCCLPKYNCCYTRWRSPIVTRQNVSEFQLRGASTGIAYFLIPALV